MPLTPEETRHEEMLAALALIHADLTLLLTDLHRLPGGREPT